MRSMPNYFTFAGSTSESFGVYISGGGTYNAPVRQYENISVPGRDGDLLGISTRLENVQLTYRCGIVENFNTQVAALRSFLLSNIGYKRLEDTYHTDEYRMAVYKGGLEPEVIKNLEAGEFDLRFECKPQRYLTSGETETTITSGDDLDNPTDFEARPLIRIVGSGTLTIGSQVITIAANTKAYIDIDSEVMDCYSGSDNCNSLVSFSTNDFPVIPAGTTAVTYSGLTSVKITPRWWRV